MTDADDRRRTATHEAGHAVMASVLGRTVGGLTIVPGKAAVGAAFCGGGEPLQGEDWEFDATQSITLWPAKVRTSFEHDALFAAAGDAAVRVLYWASGRAPEPVHLAAAELVVSEAEMTRFISGVDRPRPSDEQTLARIASWVYRDDVAARLAWLNWIAEEARIMIAAHVPQVEALAAAALQHGSLPGAAVRAILSRGDDHGPT